MVWSVFPYPKHGINGTVVFGEARCIIYLVDADDKPKLKDSLLGHAMLFLPPEFFDYPQP